MNKRNAVLTKLSQSVFSVSYNNPVGVFLFARKVSKRLHCHFAVLLQDAERLLAVAPGIGSGAKEREEQTFYAL